MVIIQGRVQPQAKRWVPPPSNSQYPPSIAQCPTPAATTPRLAGCHGEGQRLGAREHGRGRVPPNRGAGTQTGGGMGGWGGTPKLGG